MVEWGMRCAGCQEWLVRELSSERLVLREEGRFGGGTVAHVENERGLVATTR